ncbi:MAG: Na+/H+ antiporter subunit G [Hyphomicrobiaceae bacterium]|nr:Na+/H+ antiporter subunit G [Hyphomicrobiaceae bacterium]
MLTELITSLLVLIGGAFALLGSIGLARLPDFYSRLHGPTKATTLGVGSVVIASLVDVAVDEPGLGLRELAITLFLFITAPVSAHMLSKAALSEHRRRQEAGPSEQP